MTFFRFSFSLKLIFIFHRKLAWIICREYFIGVKLMLINYGCMKAFIPLEHIRNRSSIYDTTPRERANSDYIRSLKITGYFSPSRISQFRKTSLSLRKRTFEFESDEITCPKKSEYLSGILKV